MSIVPPRRNRKAAKRPRERRVSGEIVNQYREAIVGSVIAIIIEVTNFFFFEHSTAGSQIAITTAIVGILLALLRSAVQLSMNQALEPVQKLSEIVDLQSAANIAGIQSLLQRYLSVTEVEFRSVKEQIISDAAEALRRLAVEKRSATLQTADYYDWIFRQFDALRPGDYVHAVSLSSDTEWNDSQVEKKFLAKNLDAAANGAEISRIFIVEEERLANFLAIPPIQAHTVEAATGLNGYYISRRTLEKFDRRYLEEVGEGILDFNGHVGLEDRFDPDGRARGDVTMLQSDLDRMRRVYDRLMNLAEPLSESLASRSRRDTTTNANRPDDASLGSVTKILGRGLCFLGALPALILSSLALYPKRT